MLSHQLHLPPPQPLHLRRRHPFKLFCSTSSSAAATDVNNYNHLIQTLSTSGDLRRALYLLPQERSPTQRTYETLILAAAQLNSPSAAAAVHRRISDDPTFSDDPFLSTRLIEMYSKLNSLESALQVFDETPVKTIYVYNAIIKALLQSDFPEDAISICRDMSEFTVQLDSFTYSYVLKASIASSAHAELAFYRVKQIHAHVLRHAFESNIHVATTLVDAYAKLGRVLHSRRVFDGMPKKNVVSWSAMIACYAKNERSSAALGLFHELVVKEVDTLPNSVTMVSVLQACAGLAALGMGKMVHGYILRRGLDSIVSVVNALIAMYAKCGLLDAARKVFDGMGGRRDVVSWNSLISGYGIHGYGMEAIQFFEKMINMGISPSPVTFVSVLGACSHMGLVIEGKKLFGLMAKEYGVLPSSEHYACVVDLLGRAGELDEAAKIVAGMRIEPGPTVWGSLLGACRIHGNVELAEWASVKLFELEPLNAGNYVLLADIYAGAKMWEEVNRVKKELEARGLQKVQGCSWIEVKRKVYSFMSVDEMNPQIEQLHALLSKLVKEMKETGYIPDTRVVLYDLEQEEKERILLGHSEKLALAFGLINTCNKEVIRITKNLRLCEDCHAVTKFISKFAEREIFVRDVNRFHHFKDGVCSCNDYW